MTDEEQFWKEIEAAAHAERIQPVKKIKVVNVDQKILKRFRKVEDALFACRDPDNTAKGHRLKKEYERLNRIIRKHTI